MTMHVKPSISPLSASTIFGISYIHFSQDKLIEAMGYKSGKLFEVPIGRDGKVVVTSLAERVYMIMWNSAPDNRLTTVGTFHPSQNIHCMTDDAYSPSAMPFTLRWTSWHSSILMAW
jgi:hypothetical protein